MVGFLWNEWFISNFRTWDDWIQRKKKNRCTVILKLYGARVNIYCNEINSNKHGKSSSTYGNPQHFCYVVWATGNVITTEKKFLFYLMLIFNIYYCKKWQYSTFYLQTKREMKTSHGSFRKLDFSVMLLESLNEYFNHLLTINTENPVLIHLNFFILRFSCV